tara:strand:- start:415 stop:1116 length:702 start_codon:yes stop_codon:yes gene_type:complete
MTDKNNNTGNRNSGYYNSGDCNTGSDNSGNRNTGDCNSGNYNTGNRNSGYYNSGDRNSGDCNTGYYNSGDCNTGDCNSGNRNTGNRNTGSDNSGNRNTGYFNSNTPKLRLFNKDTELDFNSDVLNKMRELISDKVKPILTWIASENMSEDEKAKNPTHETTGGYLKKQDYKYCWQKGWEEMDKEERDFIISLPNFDWKIFEEITGIKQEQTKQKITLELTQDQIDKIQDILKV